ncbi:unnamed protein product [Brassica oleracea]
MLICIGPARGLHCLHSGPAEPIIHGDDKPTNILVEKKTVAEVDDFGISKLANKLAICNQDPCNTSSNVKGTPCYLDPEQYRPIV